MIMHGIKDTLGEYVRRVRSCLILPSAKVTSILTSYDQLFKMTMSENFR